MPESFILIGGTQHSMADLDFGADPERKFRDQWMVTGNVVTVDADAARAAFRETATISRRDFIGKLMDMGILNGAEAIEAAGGGWPGPFSTLLSSLPAEDQTSAQLDWLCSNESIGRDYPLLDALGAAATPALTPEQIDEQLFGYIPPA